MSPRRLAIACSLCFHAALAAALLLLAPPGRSRAPEEPARVVLLLPPGPPSEEASAAREATAREPASSPAAPRRDGEAGAAPPRPISRNPTPEDIESALTRPSDALAAPLPRSDRITGASAPSQAAAVLSPEGEARLPEAAGLARSPGAAAPPPASGPAYLPDPRSLLQQMRSAGSPPPSEQSPTTDGAPEGGSIDSAVQLPGRSPTSRPILRFPDVLSREGREADVTVLIRVDRTGAVVSATVVSSSGEPAVDGAAERAARGYLFEPANSDSIDEGTVTFHFRLKERF